MLEKPRRTQFLWTTANLDGKGITVKPDKGYELDELTVTDKNGDAVKITDKGDGKFTFTMPGSKVVVEASFKLIETEPEAPRFRGCARRCLLC